MPGRCFLVTAPRMNEMAQWLLCNDVDPNLVPYRSDVFVECDDDDRWVIRHEVYVRTAFGSLVYRAAAREYVYEQRSAPLVNDPPMWWLVEAPPPSAEDGGAASGRAENPSDCASTLAEDAAGGG